MIKAAFFDIDGTLCSFATHRVPESTKRALTRLRERGVKTIIASGRPIYEIPDELQTGYDAYLTLNGQLCFDREGTFRDNPLDPDDVHTMVDQIQDGLYDALLLFEDRAYVNRMTERIIQDMHAVGLEYKPGDVTRAYEEPVYQMCAYLDPGDEHIFMDVTKHVTHTRWTERFCDIIPSEGGKAFGIRAALKRYGLEPDEAIAFGDGENDLSMFEVVETSVAMGNAWGSVKERASYVTTDVDHDGIWNACAHFGLL